MALTRVSMAAVSGPSANSRKDRSRARAHAMIGAKLEATGIRVIRKLRRGPLSIMEKLDVQEKLSALSHAEKVTELVALVGGATPRLAWHIRCLCEAVLPNLLPSELQDRQVQNLVDNFSLVEYKRNAIVFQQGDRPDGFYCILRGSCSVYQVNNKKEMKEEAKHLKALRTPKDRALFGRFLVEVVELRTFGELAYLQGEATAERNATVIAGPPPKSKAKPGTVLLLKVPSDLYRNMLSKSTRDPHWNKKVSLLRKTLLFSHLPDHERNEIADQMEILPTMERGAVVAKYMQPVNHVAFLASGEVRVSKPQTVPYGTESMVTTTEIARCAAVDVLFIEELLDRSDTSFYRVVCTRACELFLMPRAIFKQTAMKNERTRRMIFRLARNRKQWAAFRVQDLRENPTTCTVSVTLEMMKTGNYQITPDMILSRAERVQFQEARRKLDIAVAEVNKTLRNAAEALRCRRPDEAKELANHTVKLSSQALDLASELPEVDDVAKKIMQVQSLQGQARKILQRLNGAVRRIPANRQRAPDHEPRRIDAPASPSATPNMAEARPHSAVQMSRPGIGLPVASSETARPSSAAPVATRKKRPHRRSVGFGGVGASGQEVLVTTTTAFANDAVEIQQHEATRPSTPGSSAQSPAVRRLAQAGTSVSTRGSVSALLATTPDADQASAANGGGARAGMLLMSA